MAAKDSADKKCASSGGDEKLWKECVKTLAEKYTATYKLETSHAIPLIPTVGSEAKNIAVFQIDLKKVLSLAGGTVTSIVIEKLELQPLAAWACDIQKVTVMVSPLADPSTDDPKLHIDAGVALKGCKFALNGTITCGATERPSLNGAHTIVVQTTDVTPGCIGGMFHPTMTLKATVLRDLKPLTKTTYGLKDRSGVPACKIDCNNKVYDDIKGVVDCLEVLKVEKNGCDVLVEGYVGAEVSYPPIKLATEPKPLSEVMIFDPSQLPQRVMTPKSGTLEFGLKGLVDLKGKCASFKKTLINLDGTIVDTGAAIVESVVVDPSAKIRDFARVDHQQGAFIIHGSGCTGLTATTLLQPRLKFVAEVVSAEAKKALLAANSWEETLNIAKSGEAECKLEGVLLVPSACGATRVDMEKCVKNVTGEGCKLIVASVLHSVTAFQSWTVKSGVVDLQIKALKPVTLATGMPVISPVVKKMKITRIEVTTPSKIDFTLYHTDSKLQDLKTASKIESVPVWHGDKLVDFPLEHQTLPMTGYILLVPKIKTGNTLEHLTECRIQLLSDPIVKGDSVEDSVAHRTPGRTISGQKCVVDDCTKGLFLGQVEHELDTCLAKIASKDCTVTDSFTVVTEGAISPMKVTVGTGAAALVHGVYLAAKDELDLESTLVGVGEWKAPLCMKDSKMYTAMVAKPTANVQVGQESKAYIGTVENDVLRIKDGFKWGAVAKKEINFVYWKGTDCKPVAGDRIHPKLQFGRVFHNGVEATVDRNSDWGLHTIKPVEDGSGKKCTKIAATECTELTVSKLAACTKSLKTDADCKITLTAVMKGKMVSTGKDTNVLNVKTLADLKTLMKTDGDKKAAVVFSLTDLKATLVSPAGVLYQLHTAKLDQGKYTSVAKIADGTTVVNSLLFKITPAFTLSESTIFVVMKKPPPAILRRNLLAENMQEGAYMRKLVALEPVTAASVELTIQTAVFTPGNLYIDHSIRHGATISIDKCEDAAAKTACTIVMGLKTFQDTCLTVPYCSFFAKINYPEVAKLVTKAVGASPSASIGLPLMKSEGGFDALMNEFDLVVTSNTAVATSCKAAQGNAVLTVTAGSTAKILIIKAPLDTDQKIVISDCKSFTDNIGDLTLMGKYSSKVTTSAPPNPVKEITTAKTGAAFLTRSIMASIGTIVLVTMK